MEKENKAKKKQNIKKIDEWQAANTERIVIKPRIEDRISERIQALVEAKKAKSKQSYIIDAIKLKLEEDEGNSGIGTPIDDATSDMESRAAEVLAAVDGEAGDSTDGIGIPIDDIGTPMANDDKTSDDGDALPWAEDDIPMRRRESWDDMVARHMQDVPPSMNR